MTYSLEPIGIIHSPYKEKFAVPRQPRLVSSATATIALQGDINCLEAVRGLEQFSHLWLLFLFDQNLAAGWKPTVRPPRLGGNERVGVLASRATFRPNGIGMSSVELKGIRQQGSQVFIDVGSVDLVDGTPIVDIKPYIPYSDSIPDAIGGYAESEPESIEVAFSDIALEVLAKDKEVAYKTQVIREVLAQDPRPAYKKSKVDDKEYGVRLFDWNVKFKIIAQLALVTSIDSL
ncbi:tRNA (N6-threonylcarbamoyladenosine(37)-N6)-methyltransferase TrmO [Vibrio mediterranei]|uniref:tRNA (N6-threonylcarbamoyladenosine(37)-N6)-methyltransferase TrmO n=1 Tax=Vibrio mediterranei TaxID=689 RepID=UPI000D186096|nr:tRNA (N6-threonylcarbamoyladenosine(37)-N6)-methyltransferase TrmO [Vibrio mediterranei]NOH30058.1 tRNA (N6-threonylcarbamoyladenosine(37)-N6)-methyltransferase TrmO [Vibrio mediterranei]PTC03153.1 tRNA (N6-threonylcarbamoyladenosine(37)-N6)-methyltransferase TrmO [Vibrio mediterranei]